MPLGFSAPGAQRARGTQPVFFDLSTWHLIQWLYHLRALRDAQALRTDYADQRLHCRVCGAERAWLPPPGQRHGTSQNRGIGGRCRGAHPIDWIEPGFKASAVTPRLAESPGRR